MSTQLNNQELKKVYQILNAYDQGLIVNPAESLEMDHYDEPIADKKLAELWDNARVAMQEVAKYLGVEV